MAKITQKLRNLCTMKKCFCSKETSALPAFIRWSAPEILLNPTATEGNFDVFSPSVDVYSFGMVLWEVASITDPFEEIQEDEEVKEIVCRGGRPRIDLLQNLFTPYLDLMRSCWDQNPDMRPTFKKVNWTLPKSVY
jgi:serine/threonine protein kinase